MTLEEAQKNIGRRVTYIPFEGCDHSLYEYGVIKSVNSKYVFVRYGSDTIAKSTDPRDLTLDFL